MADGYQFELVLFCHESHFFRESLRPHTQYMIGESALHGDRVVQVNSLVLVGLCIAKLVDFSVLSLGE